MIKRLRTKFICINMVIVTAMLYVIFALIIFFTGMGMEMQSRSMMQVLVDSAVRPEWVREERQVIWQPHFVVHLDKTGKVLSIDRENFSAAEEQTLREYAQEARLREQDAGALRDAKLRFQKLPGPHGQTIVFADASMELEIMENLVKSCILIGLLSFCVFLVISFLLARWAVRPVEMAWNQQRRFVADASHELKTPLTVIMTNAELLQSSEYDEAQRKGLQERILAMSRQMRGLVESLLELARVDDGAAKMVFGTVDLSEQVAEGVLPFEPIFFEKGLLLDSSIEAGIRVKASASHLRQVLDILLDNGAKYAFPGSRIQVNLRRQGRYCLLTVANPGEAIGREDLKNIFKRFYRIDKARAMNHSYGLGLSIAESIVREHKGKIWAESEHGVNTFFVQLPIQ